MTVDEATQTNGVPTKSDEATQTNGLPPRKDPQADLLNEVDASDDRWTVDSGMS